MRRRSEMKERKIKPSFPFLSPFLECHNSPQEAVVRCHTSPHCGWDWSCPGNIPLAAGWAKLGLLPVRCLCCDCAFIWITGSALRLAWLLGRTHVQTLGSLMSLSRAGLEGWISWKIHGRAGTSTVVGTARLGACKKLSLHATYLAMLILSADLKKGHCSHICLVAQF